MLKIKIPSIRLTYFLSLMTAICAVSIPLLLQNYFGFNPCPLCILQRFVMMGLCILFFFGFIFKLNKLNGIWINLTTALFSLVGVLVAGRQAWLQHLPPSHSSDCGASLEYMLQVLPVQEVLHKVLLGGSECATIGWTFLNLSLAEWSLLLFLLFFFVTCWQFYRSVFNNANNS